MPCGVKIARFQRPRTPLSPYFNNYNSMIADEIDLGSPPGDSTIWVDLTRTLKLLIEVIKAAITLYGNQASEKPGCLLLHLGLQNVMNGKLYFETGSKSKSRNAFGSQRPFSSDRRCTLVLLYPLRCRPSKDWPPGPRSIIRIFMDPDTLESPFDTAWSVFRRRTRGGGSMKGWITIPHGGCVLHTVARRAVKQRCAKHARTQRRNDFGCSCSFLYRRNEV